MSAKSTIRRLFIAGLGPGRWPGAVLLWAVFFALYALSSARVVQGGDAGELMTLAARGGIAHPPGYPLYVLSLRALHVILSFASVALLGSLFSAALSALSLVLLERALRMLGIDSAVRLLAVPAFATSTLVWRWATVTEVFAGALLIQSLILWLAARRSQGPVSPVLAGLVLAAGIAHHHSVLFAAPLFVYILWPGGKAGAVALAGSLFRFAITAALGFLPYLLLLRPSFWIRVLPFWSIKNLSDLVDHFLRRPYGTFQLGVSDAAQGFAPQVRHYLGVHLVSLWPFVLLALLGIYASVQQKKGRSFYLVVLASWSSFALVFLAMFHFPVDINTLRMTTRFYLFADLFVFVLAAAGAQFLYAALEPKIKRPVLLGAGGGVLIMALLHAPLARHDDKRQLARLTRQILQRVAPDAIILGSSDNMMGAMLFAQQVQGLRPDVLFVYPPMLAAPWYRDFVQRQAQKQASFAMPRSWDTQGLIQANLGQRPIYLNYDRLSDLGLQMRLHQVEPAACIMRIRAPKQAPVSLQTLAKEQLDCNAAVEQGRQSEAIAKDAQLFNGWADEQLAKNSLAIARAYRLLKQKKQADLWQQQARVLAPWIFSR